MKVRNKKNRKEGRKKEKGTMTKEGKQHAPELLCLDWQMACVIWLLITQRGVLGLGFS